ncbi:MAG: efflux transporter outer membrane subunit [Sulfuricaulis sp.]|uniref:efflux transporter outer membrane subunit n=1 Tax=Sulfuricaulis sp. TaxID=2003553 RepID=UPI0034A33DFC
MTERKIFLSLAPGKMTRQPLGAAVLALLAGCSFIPVYERPAAPVPEHFAGVTATAAGPLASWREYFPDPAFHVLIEAALDHNRDLRIALARVEEARALAGIARADRFPTLEAQASGNRSRTLANISGANQTLVFNRYDVGLGLTAFELDFWGRVAALSASARAQYLATDEAAKSFRIGLISDVANTWLQLTELSERERLVAQTLKTRVEGLDITRKRQEAGLSTDLDVLAAESFAESLRAQWADLKRQRLQTDNALRLLTGMAVALPAPTNLANQPLLAELAPGLPSEVLLRRPDVRAAEQQLLAANANVGAARAAFFPRIALTANFGTASRELSGLFESGSKAWLFNPVLTLPLFDAGRTRANVDVAEARKVQAVANYEKTVQQAFREVVDSLAAGSTIGEQVAALEANLRAQLARFDRVKAREQAGIANYLEVLDASRETFSAEQSLVSSRRQLQSARVSLYKSLGGGEE